MNIKRRFPLSLAFGIGALLLVGCAELEVTDAKKRVQGGAKNSTPAPVVTPTPCPPGKLCGSTDADQTGEASSVLSIRVDPATLSVNSPPIGGTSADFASTGQLTAQVSTIGAATNSVTWTSAASEVVSVDPVTGLVAVLPGASAQTVEITAIPVADPLKTAKALVTVTTHGVVSLGID